MQGQIDLQNQRLLEQQIQMTNHQQQMAEQQAAMALQHQQLMTQILAQLQQLEGIGMPRYDNVVRNSFQFNPKVEFPSFDGNDPKGWIKKCTRYFTLCKISDDQKANLASLHLKGIAETWFSSYVMGRRNVT